MGIFGSLLFPWGILLQALAIVHFIRRRPDTYWLYIILFLGPIGAIVYLFAEAAPDFGLLRQSFKVFPRRKRIRELESAVLDNPSAGNYEELADLYMEVRPDARRRGYGSFLIQELVTECYLAGRVPAARTSTDNIASQRTLLKGGLRECGRMLRVSIS